MTKNLLLVDGNSIGFAAQASPKLSSGGNPTQAIFGTIRTLRRLLEEDHRDARPIVYWDGASWRKDLCDDYKANRDDDPKQAAERDEYRRQKPMIGRMLAALGIEQRVAGNLEADDLIALEVAARSATLARGDMTIVSGDRDLIQLVRPGVDWHNPIRLAHGREPKFRRVTAHDFAEITGYETPWGYVQGKALMGDASDNLKGVDGIGEKAAPLIVNHWGSVPAAIKELREKGADALPAHLRRYRKKLLTFANDREQLERFKRNLALMHLHPDRIPDAQSARVSAPKLSRESFVALCEELAFTSILKSTDVWLRPFAQLHKEAV